MTAVPKLSLPDLKQARANMIESQLRPNRVRDERILGVMETLPRELFVPAPMVGIAYIDEDIQVSTGRYLLEPMVLARFLEEAKLKASDHVLDIAPATGYSTAVIASMAKDVVALETDSLLEKQMAKNLATLNIGNVTVKLGNLTEGCAAEAPFDVILINGGVEKVPDILFTQLAEGGRLLAVVRNYGPAHAAHTGDARLYTKIRGVISSVALFDANVKLLPGFALPKKFVF